MLLEFGCVLQDSGVPCCTSGLGSLLSPPQVRALLTTSMESDREHGRPRRQCQRPGRRARPRVGSLRRNP